MVIPDELTQLISAQDGLVTRRQALCAGVTPAAIAHALGRGRKWQHVTRGVYATFTGPLQPRHHLRAALLTTGDGGVVSGAMACRAYGLRYVPETAETVVLIPERSRRRTTPFVVVRRTTKMPESRDIAGIPTASPEQAVLDVCRGMSSLRDIRALLCEAVQRGLTTPDRILTMLGDARWKGSGLVRRSLDDLTAGCRSAPECELRDLVRRSTVLIEPRWNALLPGTMHRIRPDACWPEARVVVEIDSAEWHRFGDSVERTERRRALYASLGWTVVPVSPRRLREEPDAVLREIEAAVAAGLARTA
ncbi:type IV toxin-antitoxin system AbiEi family antitoxin domain-containing protein [Phytoactinopolyspora halotolerans]|uniref:DUF559 domain-containing protein n=1 Tax=Phytoactinopolyspora halotolerans TaxID=1981512 RepID=A0A6L9S612_9ACTN|nr:type IV toxin-antitoxin system AbiEi family antitoxin domain-containing protein [Phytoactinopolyspora halotolerans]NED99951.1 hypothetical protein [Phytoactinopolyspora halotolerans]